MTTARKFEIGEVVAVALETPGFYDERGTVVGITKTGRYQIQMHPDKTRKTFSSKRLMALKPLSEQFKGIISDESQAMLALKEKEDRETLDRIETLIETLKKSMAGVERIDPASDWYNNITRYLDTVPTHVLQKLVDAEIKFISGLARNRLNARKRQNG